MTSLKKDKRNNFHDDCTFISSYSEQEDYEEPQSVNRVYDQMDTLCIGKAPRKITLVREQQFISISQYYEALMASKIKQSNQYINPHKHFQSTEALDYECFCLKRLKMIYHFVAHIEHCHGLEVQSLDYLRGKQILKTYGLDSKHFKLTQSQYLEKIQKKHYSQLVFPQQMKLLVSNNLKTYVKKHLKILLILSIPPENFYSSLYKLTLSHPKPHLFSRQFMQDIRDLLTRHVTTFDRRIDIHVKNMSLRDGLWALLWALEGTFWEVKRESFAKRSRNRPIFQISNLLQCICRHFLSWIDDNYAKILQKNSIYHSHIELEANERYSEVSRMWKCDLFVREYLRHIQGKYVGDTVLQFVKLFVEALQIYSQQITETEIDIFMITEGRIT